LAVSGSTYFAVWQDWPGAGDTDINGIMFSASGWPTAGSPIIPISAQPDALNQYFPRVSSNADCSPSTRYLVVYEQWSGQGDIWAARVGTNTSVSDRSAIPAAQGTQMWPAVGSNGPGLEFLVAWNHHGDAGAPPVGGGPDIHAAKFTCLALPVSSFTVEAANGSQSQPEIAWTGDSYQIVWDDTRQGVNNSDVYGIGVRPGGELIGTAVSISSGSSSEVGSALVGGAAANGLVAYYHLDANFGTDTAWARWLHWSAQGEGCAAAHECRTGYCVELGPAGHRTATGTGFLTRPTTAPGLRIPVS
jgi:hypothetical protein